MLHREVEGQGPDVVLVHGLFGMGNNLGLLSRELRDGYRVTRVDLPNHGRSPWQSGSDIPRMADSLLATLDAEGVERCALLGHSLGGKVCMELALAAPDRVAALVVADIAPAAYPPGHDDVFAALKAVAGQAPRSRQSAAQSMAPFLDDDRVVQFLLLSLVRDEEGVYRWRFNLEELLASYAAYRANISEGVYEGPVLFLKGEQSDYIQPEHREAIESRFPHAKVRVLREAGHWLHAEQPRLFNNVVKRFMAQAWPPES